MPTKPHTKTADLWAKIPLVWKAIGVIVAIFVAGVTTTAYVRDKTDEYVEKTTFQKEAAATAAARAELENEIRQLQAQDAATTADVRSIKEDTAAMRDDVRTLLNFMLANPPAPRAVSPPKPKRP